MIMSISQRDHGTTRDTLRDESETTSERADEREKERASESECEEVTRVRDSETTSPNESMT